MNPLWILVGSAIVVLLILLYKDHVRRRATGLPTGDFVVETAAAITVPDHCVNCLQAHAGVPLRVMPHIPPGYGPLIPLLDPELRTKFVFRYCKTCAALIRRQRLYGTIVLGFAFTMIGVTALAAVILVIGFPKGHSEPEALWWIGSTGLVASTFIGLPLAFIGQRLHRYAAGVSIVNRGQPTIVFHFTSHVYRDHFAAMNGAVAVHLDRGGAS